MSADLKNVSSRTNILSLSDDIILILFDHLSPNFQDQVFFGLVNQRFSYLFKLWAKSKKTEIRSIDLEEILLPNLIDFFQLGGSFVTTITIDCDLFEKESLIVEFVATYCTNLLQVDFCNVSDSFHYGNLLHKVHTLRKVTIHCIDSDDVLSFDLSPNRGLTTFELISGCYTGHNLICLPNLQHLVLRDCLLWDSDEFVTPLRNLKTLELADCSFEVTNIPLFQKIADHCNQLEDFTFSCCDSNYDMVAKLPKLKRLTLTTWMHSNELQSSFLDALVVQKCQDLECLKFLGQIEIARSHARAIGQMQALKELFWYNNNINDEDLSNFDELENLEVFSIDCCRFVTKIGVMRLLQKCKKLRLIYIRCTDNISDDFILDAVRFYCKRRDYGELRPALVIQSEYTSVTPDVLKHPDYILGNPFFKLKLIY